jgi:hypothetical protein
MLYIANHSDNFSRSFFFFGGIGIEAQPQVLADRVLIREITVDEGLVDDDCPGRSAGIVIVQIASFLQRDTERGRSLG